MKNDSSHFTFENKGVLLSILKYQGNIVLENEIVPQSCNPNEEADVSLIKLESGGFAVCDRSFDNDHYTSIWEGEDSAREYFKEAIEWFENVSFEFKSEYRIKVGELHAVHRKALTRIHKKHADRCSAIEKIYLIAHGVAKSVYDEGLGVAVDEYTVSLAENNKEHRLAVASLEASYGLGAGNVSNVT